MNSVRPISMSDNTNFTAKYNITILRKNNKHKPYLNNEIGAFIKGKGITTLYETKAGTEQVILGADLKSQMEAIFSWLREAGIKREKNIRTK